MIFFWLRQRVIRTLVALNSIFLETHLMAILRCDLKISTNAKKVLCMIPNHWLYAPIPRSPANRLFTFLLRLILIQ